MKRNWAAFAAPLLFTMVLGCKSDVEPESDTPVTVPNAPSSPTPTPAPTPTPTPAPGSPTGSPVPSGGLQGLASIASNFNVAADIIEAPVPGTAAPDVVGAFRFTCTAGQLLYDDPIVFPGQPGKSHLHQFYGNTAANANSTFQSLRTSGDSTCMSPVNRSAYWMPAMLNGAGSVVRPDYITIYYKRRPSSDPICSLSSGDPKAMGNCVGLPNGLRFVFGYDMITNRPPPAYHYACDGTGAGTGSYKNIEEAAPNCVAGGKLGLVITAPQCWDGKNLDSPNHRDHVAYATYGNWGYLKCPSTHPYVIPTFTLGAWYSIEAGDNLSRWELSSDAMHPELPNGSTFHADWFGAWDNGVMNTWMAYCIDKLLNCSGGRLGNGTKIRQAYPFQWEASPRLVPVAARPA